MTTRMPDEAVEVFVQDDDIDGPQFDEPLIDPDEVAQYGEVRAMAIRICEIAASAEVHAPAVSDVARELDVEIGEESTLACLAWAAVFTSVVGARSAYLEAAALLREGWSPGDSVPSSAEGDAP